MIIISQQYPRQEESCKFPAVYQGFASSRNNCRTTITQMSCLQVIADFGQSPIRHYNACQEKRKKYISNYFSIPIPTTR